MPQQDAFTFFNELNMSMREHPTNAETSHTIFKPERFLPALERAKNYIHDAEFRGGKETDYDYNFATSLAEPFSANILSFSAEQLLAIKEFTDPSNGPQPAILNTFHYGVSAVLTLVEKYSELNTSENK